jgi:hypothetical protein
MFEALVGKRVVLFDRVFAVQEGGRIVYPTTAGTLLAATDRVLSVRLSDEDEPMLFFIDALRCVREVKQPAPQPEAQQQQE